MLNVKVDRKELLKAIQIVENAVTENKIREVLSGIYIEAKENKIILKGTDLELSINTEISGEIISEGKIVIKHKLIEEFLKQILDEKIELIEEQGKLVIKTDSTNTEFSLYDAENFPTQSKMELGLEYTFNKNKLLSYIENVKISASADPENLAVNCIRFEIEENKLKLVSSDTYRLTYIEEELEENEKNKEGLSVSIPLKTIEGLIKIMRLIDEENIIFKSDGTKVFFKFSNVEILTRVIELQFPDYKSILKNAQHDKKVLLNTKDFLSVLKRTLIFVRDNKDAKNGGIFSFENNKLVLTGINENAKIKEELATIQEGEDLKISLNVKFLLDYISILDGKVTELKLMNSKSSVLVKDEESDASLYFTMPLALREG
ncbi:DNA polymerase III subunit beta [Pseudoleptotrichia goodfellowii]|uniref:Beta sliding clamp n=2 Tax=Pseudoleptotrichia goodfellowii TaxID=157692 RepID=D0GKI0_9FUSO|nr:DNA polymerase III subunit beta [Pseudoleptotrichia goodfellowii]EEY35386.1 DNA polymerase III, beta subunit [Pseudoleptotrichia goodfellowii F0264]BBM36243.1 DNA polymerase III subunit beta [Pseudoleptotrichia goodfellowii]